MKNLSRHLLSFVLCVVASSVAHAQTYPSRTITLINSSVAGSPMDLMSRMLAQHLQTALGGTVIVDNKPGATGAIAAGLVMRSPADGYTLLLGNSSSHITAPLSAATPPFDALKDFTPIGNMIRFPFFAVAYPGLPSASMKDFLALAKARPGTYNYGSIGVGSGAHLVGEYFKKAAGVNLVHVPYKAVPPMQLGLMAGEVAITFDSVLAAAPHVRAGKMKPYAVSSAVRSSVFPDVPTIAESGIPGFDETVWNGLMGPRGMPPELVQRLNAEVNKFLVQPAVIAKFGEQGGTLVPGTPEEFTRDIRDGQAKWSKFIKELGLKIE
jgi:tripartite-type tricarboxylate transporter receptor subunit TctC